MVIKVRHVKNSFIPKLLNVNAITLYPFIMYNSQFPSIKTVKHELIHIKQIRTVGAVRFYLSYLLLYVSYRLMGMPHYSAYRAIPYERQAYGDDDILF